MKAPIATHERLIREEEITTPSDRSFGIVFAIVFTIMGLWTLPHTGEIRLLSLGIALAFLLISLVRPGLLAPLNRLWARLGFLLHRLVSPLVLALLFYLVITPTGLFMRVFGRDILGLHFQPEMESYWILRNPPGPDSDTMTNQF